MADISDAATQAFLADIAPSTQTLFNFSPTLGSAVPTYPNPDNNTSAQVPTVSLPLIGMIEDNLNSLNNVEFFFQDAASGVFSASQLDNFTDWVSNLYANSDNGKTALTDPATQVPTTRTYQAFYDAFLDMIGSTAQNPLGDLSNLSGTDGQTDSQLLNSYFVNSMNHFLTYYVYQPTSSTTPGALATQFVSAWYSYMTSRVSIDTSPTATGVTLSTYQNLYFSFVPNATEAGFQANLQTFYNNIDASNGYFLPSQFLNQWFANVQSITDSGNTIALSSISGTDSSKTEIIFELFNLISDMIGTLQDVAASQSNLLTFYANAQEAYTNLIGKIPTITIDRMTPYIKGASSSGDTSVNTLYTEISAENDAFSQKLQSYRSILGDDANQQQSVVNQTNESVNQQADIATSLLQELNTILQSIFK